MAGAELTYFLSKAQVSLRHEFPARLLPEPVAEPPPLAEKQSRYLSLTVRLCETN
jgi:hypothetical protein